MGCCAECIINGIYRNASVGTGISVTDGNWHHITVTWRSSDGQTRLYRDGSQAFSGALAAGTSITGGGSLVIAQEQDNTGNAFDPTQAFLGIIDEVRISNIIRSPDWIETSFNNQDDPLSFLAFGVQEVFVPAPAMTEWGMIIFMLFAGIISVYYLERKII